MSAWRQPKRPQTTTLKTSEVAKLKVGNAGGVEVRLNGKPLPRSARAAKSVK
jgi:hypothetical protein